MYDSQKIERIKQNYKRDHMYLMKTFNSKIECTASAIKTSKNKAIRNEFIYS